MKKLKRCYCREIIGEPKFLENSPLKYLKMTEAEANKLCKIVCKYDKLMEHCIVYNKRKTKYTMASYDEGKIFIYNGYGTVHIILHEIAHNYDSGNEIHDEHFLKCFMKYIKMWNKKWYKEFEIVDRN